MLVRLLGALLTSLVLAPSAVAGPPGHWESQPPAPAPRQEAAFAALGDKLHLVGGFEYGGADSARHEIYDVATRTWTVAAPLPEPSHHLQGAAIGSRLYVVGGLQTLQFVVTGRLWEYDPGTGMWSARASLPAGRARGGGAAVAHDGRLYFAGGLRDGAPQAQVDVYDPATDSWTALPDMPTPRDHLGIAVVDGLLYAVGGRQASFESEIAATEALDLAKGTWRTGLARIPTLRAGFATAAFNGEIATVGGESQAGPHEHVEAYHPATDSWRTLAPMPLPRHGIQGVAHSNGVWVAGGGTDLLVAATAALDVLYPGPRPIPGAPPTAMTEASPPAHAGLSVRVDRVRRGTRRVIVRVTSSRRSRATVEVRDGRGRRLGRADAAAGPATRRITVNLRRTLRRGRYTVTVRAGGVRARRSFRVR